MGTSELYSMQELVRRSGIPAATIHHYRRTGLLPAPRRVAANRFLYDDRHLRALRVIRSVRARRNVPLPTIRRVMPKLLEACDGAALRPEAIDLVLGQGERAAGGPSTRDRLLAAAIAAFARRGYASVNVDEICRSAKVAKGSFYRHYRSKEELFFAAADGARAEVIAEFAKALIDPAGRASPNDALSRGLESRLPIFMDLFTRAVQRRSGYARVARRVFSALAMEVGEQLGSDQPVAAGAFTLALAAAGIFREALEPSPLADLASMATVTPLFGSGMPAAAT